MKISCTQENLNQGLFVVSHVASKNTSLPILNNILVQATDNEIKLSSTNLEIGVSCSIRGKVEESGEFTVQSKLLSDYVNLLPKEIVNLESPKDSNEVDQVLKVKCKNNSTKIKGQEASDFPVIPSIEKNNIYKINVEKFRQAVGQVIFAVSTSETRPEINGVLFDVENNKLTLAATDSYRLAEKVTELSNDSSGQNIRIIIPTRTLQEVQRILGSFKDPAAISEIENIEVCVSDNQVSFSFGDIELVSRLVEGQYPDYRQIIPKDSKTKAVISTTELVGATKTASLFSRSGIYDVSLDFNESEKNIVISSVNSQVGENTSSVSADITGSGNNITVNFRYLLDGLQNINDSTIEVGVIDESSPCVLKPISSDDYTYIVMPIKQ